MSFPQQLQPTPKEPLPEAGRVSNTTIDIQLEHRTIRAFKEEPLPEDVVATLLDVARHAPTAAFYQQCTIIRVLDAEIREVIHQASGQPYVGGNRAELFMFVVDLARNARIREQAGVGVEPLQQTTLFMHGVEDTLLAAQNLEVAAESLGLGTCYLGSINANPRSVIEALKLPKYTYPLVGMLVGYSDQEPQLKPRLPREVTTAVDTYPDWDAPEYVEAMAYYDQVIRTYYDLRESGRHQDSFTHQVCTKPGAGKAEQTDMLTILREQGLCLS